MSSKKSIEEHMSTQEEKNEKVAEMLTAAQSKGALIEKIVFAGIPILFSCVVYLMSALSSANSELIQLKSKIAVVVNNDNKAIPPQGTTIDMAEIREKLTSRIDQVERDAALARGNMTLEREKQLASLEKQRMEMNAEAEQARAAIRADDNMGLQKLREDLGDRMDKMTLDSAVSRSSFDKRISILELQMQNLPTIKGK
jgi:hypothetical protein